VVPSASPSGPLRTYRQPPRPPLPVPPCPSVPPACPLAPTPLPAGRPPRRAPRLEDHDFVVGRPGRVGGRNLVSAVERPDRNALECKLPTVGEPRGMRLPIADANAFVVHRHVVVKQSDRGGDLEIISHECQERAVDPAPVAPVGLTPHALPQKANALGVPLCPFVETVDLELEPVVAEIANEMALQLARRLVGDAVPAIVRMDGETFEMSDPRTAVLLLEAHRTCTLTVHLDHEAPVRRWIPLR